MLLLPFKWLLLLGKKLKVKACHSQLLQYHFAIVLESQSLYDGNALLDHQLRQCHFGYDDKVRNRKFDGKASSYEGIVTYQQ